MLKQIKNYFLKSKFNLIFLRFAILFFVIFSQIKVSFGTSDITLPTGSGLPTGTVSAVLLSFLKWLLGIFGFAAIISFVISGIMYFIAVGNSEEAQKAKKQMEWSILGVVVGLSGYIMITAITSWFGGSTTF